MARALNSLIISVNSFWTEMQLVMQIVYKHAVS